MNIRLVKVISYKQLFLEGLTKKNKDVQICTKTLLWQQTWPFLGAADESKKHIC